MQKNNRFFDDLTKLASTATGSLLEMKREMENAAATQIEKMLKKMDLVKREEFDIVREMAVKARQEQDALAKRLAALEKQLAPASKPATRKLSSEDAIAAMAAMKKPATAKKPAKAKTKPKTTASAPNKKS